MTNEKRKIRKTGTQLNYADICRVYPVGSSHFYVAFNGELARASVPILAIGRTALHVLWNRINQ